MSAPLTIVNPSDRDDHQAKHQWSPYVRYTKRYVLWFGACGPTYLMVWGRSLDAALETAADWLADNAPGHIMLRGDGNDERDPQLDELMSEACKDAGLAWPMPEPEGGPTPEDLQPYWDAEETAYADLTHTDRGYLTSSEWGIALDEHASRADVKAFIASLAERHYSDDPVVAVG